MSAVALRSARAPETLPRSLAGFRDFHAGETIIVCGCGPSLRDITQPERFVTIGVNDVGRLFTPDYLMVVNTRHQFAGGRFEAVERSGARALFTQLDLGVPHPHVVRFRLGQRGGTDFSNPDTLNYTRNSPYPALCLAIHMGAKRIGLIGVDFTAGHFFGGNVPHSLARELPQIDAEYRRLAEACARLGIEIHNLSAESRLTAFPKTTIDAFAAASQPARPLRILSYATTPVAGVPAMLGREIARATGHEGRTVWAANGYGNGVVFDGDVEYRRNQRQAAELLDAADVVVVHNGKVDPRHAAAIAAKPVVTLAHNYMWNVDKRFVDAGYPGLVVGQYQATLPEFAGWTPVPNPIPLWEDTHAAAQPADRQGPVTICFVPSGQHERYPAGHRLFWHAKGYRSTMAVLDGLARSHGIRLEVLRGGQVSHREALAMKRRSHIVIDECVTGSYHRASLEGLAVGAVVVNGIGQLAGVPELLGLCAGGAAEMPFVPADLASLHDVLVGLIERGPDALAEDGRRNRAWMETHWNFERQWPAFWLPAIERATAVWRERHRPAAALPVEPTAPASPILALVPATPARLPPEPAPPLPSGPHMVTAVIALDGDTSPSSLEATLAALRTQGLDSIVIVETGTTPTATTVAVATGARHIFASHEPTNGKAWARNAGAAAATGPFVLWCDAGIVLPPGFIAAALAEMDQRRLDYLIPWTSIRYVAPADGAATIDNIAALDPIKARYSRHGDRDAVGLVRTAFLDAHGGLCDVFADWGGQEQAFFHKASLFGRAAATNRNAQHAYRLLDPPASPADTLATQASVPRNAGDLALLREIGRIGSRDRFRARFAPPSHRPAPWPGVKRLFCAPGAQAIGGALNAFYGPAIALSESAADADHVLQPHATAAANGALSPAELITIAISLTQPEASTMASAQPAAAPPQPVDVRLNLGCGDASVPGFVNVDRFLTSNVDQQADLASPWPWADSSVAAIRAWDIIEHLPDKILTMNEMWRVLRPGGTAEIAVPTTDGPGAFQDPTHVSFWHRRSFLYYEAGNPYRERFAASYGITAAFRVLREHIDHSLDGPRLTIVLEAVKR
jgi:hypothetical protein